MTERISTRLTKAIGRRAPGRFSLESLRSRIVLFALLAATIPTAVTAWIAYTQTRRSLTRQYEQELQSVAGQAVRELEIWQKERLYDARVFATSYEVVENIDRIRRSGARSALGIDALARLRNYLQSVQERFPDYAELLVIDPEARTIASGLDQAGEVKLPSDWLDRVRSAREVSGEVYWDEALAKAILPLAVPIQAADGRFLGALAARIDLGPMREMLAAFAPGESGAIYLATGTGGIVVSSRGVSAELLETDIPEPAREHLLQAVNQSIGFENHDKVEVVGTLRQLPRLEWWLVVEIPRVEAYAAGTRLRNFTLGLVIALLLAVGLIAYRLAVLIVRPLDRMITGAAEVAAGDFQVALPLAGRGEVGYLTEVFNYMVGQIRARREELEAAQEDLKKKNEELERLSVTDALTGLYNRRLLMESLTHEAQRSKRTGKPFALLVMDVDHFKKFNDTYGHQAGDQVLVTVGAVLKECTRIVDCAARYGGEEFVVMLPETDLDGGMDVAERIRQRTAERKLALGEEQASVTMSLGVAEFPTDGETVEAMIAAADNALYQAKKGGRNRVVPTRQEGSRRRRSKAAVPPPPAG